MKNKNMGLYAHAKGLTAETSFDCGYISYNNFLICLVEAAYGEEMGKLYRKTEWSDKDIEYWNKHCDDNLDILLFHSDCDGKFTPQECRKIYNAIKNLKMDLLGHNYGTMEQYNMLDHWKYIFKHCANKRVNLYYS